MSDTTTDPGEAGLESDIAFVLAQQQPLEDDWTLLERAQDIAKAYRSKQADCERWSGMYARQADELVAVKADRGAGVNSLLSEVIDKFMDDALVAIAGSVCTPEKGYSADGGLRQLLADIKTLRKQHDGTKARLAEVEAERDRQVKDNEMLAAISELTCGFREASGREILSRVEWLAAAEARLAEVEQEKINALISRDFFEAMRLDAWNRAEAAESERDKFQRIDECNQGTIDIAIRRAEAAESRVKELQAWLAEPISASHPLVDLLFRQTRPRLTQEQAESAAALASLRMRGST